MEKKGLCLEKSGHLAALLQIIELLCDVIQNRVEVLRVPCFKQKPFFHFIILDGVSAVKIRFR